MRFSALRLTTPPASEPLSLADAKAQIRVDDDYSDDLITALISAVRRDVEAFLGRALITQTWTMVLDEFPDGSGGGRLTNSFMSHNLHAYRKFRELEIPRPPLQAINSIKYIGRTNALDPNYDSAYDPSTLLHTMDPANYQVDLFGEPGRVAPQTNLFWPFTNLNLLSPSLNSVIIEFDAGYADDAETVATYLPNAIAAMKMMIGHLFENRESVITGLRAAAIEIPRGAQDLLWPDRIVNFF
jgi:Phage gp6-like head-tail connector protein